MHVSIDKYFMHVSIEQNAASVGPFEKYLSNEGFVQNGRSGGA